MFLWLVNEKSVRIGLLFLSPEVNADLERSDRFDQVPYCVAQVIASSVRGYHCTGDIWLWCSCWEILYISLLDPSRWDKDREVSILYGAGDL